MNRILLLLFIITIKSTIQQDIIQLNEKAFKTISLKSVLKKTNQTNESNSMNRQVWLFKRIYSIPILNNSKIDTQLEVSPTETMVSLDTEVQSNLNTKYSIDTNTFDLIIHNLTYADSGLYICNQWNQKSIHYKLIVTQPVSKAELVSTDLKQVIQESTNLTMKCISKHSYPYPNIKWFQNNKEMNHVADFKLIDKEQNVIESELHLVNITSSLHMNNFSCKLIQEEQEQLWQSSGSISLNVGFKPLVHIELVNKTLTNNKLTLYDDTDITFKCNYKSNPLNDAKIEWKLNNITQKNDINEFNWLKRTDRMDLTNKLINLTCQVTNSIGTGSFTYQISLIHEPIIKLNKTVYEVDELNTLQINCQIDSSPAPSIIEWRHYSNEITQTSTLVSTSQLLEFKSIKHTETNGYYVCSAQNDMVDSFGKRKKVTKQSSQVEINVKFMPQLNLVNKKLAVNLSQLNQNITCLTLANPQPTFNWYKNGNKINTNPKYTISNVEIKSKNVYENVLTINNLNEYDLNSNYECEATNQLGTKKLKIELVPLSKPDTPTELRIVYSDFMSLGLAWSDAFDGGLSQFYQIKLNETVYNLTNDSLVLYKPSSQLANLTNLTYNTLYSVSIKAQNVLGASEWSESIQVKTADLMQSDAIFLPKFERLFFNVVKNRLEFRLYESKSVKFCFKLSSKQFNSKCLLVDNLERFQLDNLNDSTNKTIEFKSIKDLKVSICFELKQNICSEEFNATFESHSKMMNKYDLNKSTGQDESVSIPVSLITGICVCILSLLSILFFSVLYCIRRRNFKLCKNLLNKDDDSESKKKSTVISTIDKLKATFTDTTHTNKSFNVDLPSASGSNNSSDGYGSADLNLASANSSGSLINTKRTLVSALTNTASNIINNTLARNRQSEILVTEDSEQHKSKRQSKLLTTHEENSNCSSSLNNNGIYIYSDLNYNDQVDLYNTKGLITYDAYNAGAGSSGSSGASNTDPIAINNSLSSTDSSVDSRTYGYNIAAATITNNGQNNQFRSNENTYEHEINTDNLVYIKNGCLMIDNFVQIDETTVCNNVKNATLLRQQSKNNSYITNNIMTNHTVYNETPESGYSTPSRPKKVVYEVIV